jgi:type II secretory pathway component PulF
MPQFAYRARKRSGELVEGTLEVGDRGAALMQIERLGLFPVAVDVAKASAAQPGAPARERGKFRFHALLPPTLWDYLQRPKRPKLREMATYTQQLANLLQAGMPLTLALNSMTHIESKGIKSGVSKQLRQEVMEGRSLSDAMSRQPVIFSDLYINMVRAGESSGALVDVLRRMAAHFERFAEVQSKFVSAMVYPAIVAFVGVTIAIVFMVKILPTFISIFEGMEMQLPLMTQILVDLSNFLRSYWWLLVLIGIALFILVRRYQASPQGKRNMDEWKMRAPVFGKVVRLNLFGQFARTLSTLLENGVPVLTALKITEQIMPNSIVKEAVAKTREAVTDGKAIAQPLAQSRIFPQLMVDLVRIGEETGDVPGSLKNVAETYERDLDIALRTLTNLIEPIMIIVMAIGVCFLLLSVLSAMFAMTSNIAR